MTAIHRRAPVALLPGSPWALAALAGLLAALGYVVASRTVPKAYAFAVLCLAMMFVDFAEYVLVGSRSVAAELGFRTRDVATGAWWQPLSYMFVHAGWNHLVGNLLLLVIVGPLIESRMGDRAFLAIYGAAGLAAAASHVGVEAAGIVPAGAIAVGASGALFGVLTAFAYHWGKEPIPLPSFPMVRIPALLVLVLYIVINLAYMARYTQIAWYGHFAGFLVGIPAAILLKPATGRVAQRRLPDPQKLEPLATTPTLQDILQRLRETSGTARDDPTFAEAWLDRFFAKARCPAGHLLERDGLTARCAGGEYRVVFGR